MGCDLAQGILEALGGLLQLALKGVDLLRDILKLFLGEHSCLGNLVRFAIGSAHGAADADRDLREFVLLGHFVLRREGTIVYPNCGVRPTKSQTEAGFLLSVFSC